MNIHEKMHVNNSIELEIKASVKKLENLPKKFKKTSCFKILEKLKVKNLLKMYSEIVIKISIKNLMLNAFKTDE